ncbi:hypothetical protein RGUI_3715 [Rhodovulum sp. P5]|uniref:c-type cytochrome n=1 Tax=Rhodovulum sp. P5 TaxID=1564506 RepID=UPI0009C36C4E|nr:cytochrome c [Rhodovulum sp. P5]ARE41856.1 hypothetical protein RGUI_3715 [Rhodovulum sp. P5]
MRTVLICTLFCAALGSAGQATAQTRNMTLAADARLEDSGLLAFLIPRFSLKTGIRVSVTSTAPSDLAANIVPPADAVIGPKAVVERLFAGASATPIFQASTPDGGGLFAIALPPNATNAELGARFADWLTSDIGQRTVAQFASPSGVVYIPGAQAVAVAEPTRPQGDEDRGAALALLHCGRCHVVSAKNRFGGIGSTPSFAALRTIPGWEDKFRSFWRENPHPAFTQVAGVTVPFDPARPPHIAPVELTPEDVEAITAYAASITPADLGAGVQAR